MHGFGRLALMVVCVAAMGAATAFAQENLDAGKTPAQLFASDCSVCHQSPKGLAKGTNSSSLSGFLRQHYTSSQQNAATIAAYLLSGAGAGEPRPLRQPTAVTRTPTPPEPPSRERNARTAKRHAKPKSEEPRKRTAETAKPSKKPEKKEKKQAALPAEKPAREPKSQGDTKPDSASATAAEPKRVTAIAPPEPPVVRTLPSGAKAGESPGGPRQDAVPLAGALPTTRPVPRRTDDIAD